MFKIYTSHTSEVGETVFEHFAFTAKVASKMCIGALFLIIHGLSGGLLGVPEKYNICSLKEFLCDADQDREERKENNNE
jgi:hypothetical protein